MKKVLSFILVLVLMFTMLSSVSAASVPTMTMSSSSGHDVGDTVTLTISFDYGENKIKSIAIDSFTYDKSVLKLNSLSWEIGGFLSATDPDGDSLIAFASATEVSGAVMTAEVEVIGHSTDLTQEITFNALVAPESGSNISASVTGGVITLNPAKITGTQAVAITAPVKGATPQNTIVAGSGYTGTITWDGNPTKFAANTVYAANITLTATAGYIFDSNATGNVSGANITNNSVSSDGRTLTFKATFPKTADKDAPTCTAPANVTAIYGQKLSDITLTNPAGNTAGTWTWAAPTTSVGNVGTRTFKATFTPADTSNYLTVENVDVSVTVNPKPITVTVDNIADQQYTGSQIKPTVTVKGDGKTLELNTDYTVEYGTNKNAGANGGSVTVKAKSGSNYTFSNTIKNFNIVAKAGQVTISGNLNVTYSNAVPDVTIDKHGSDGNVTVYYYTNEACTSGRTTTKPTNVGNYWAKAEMAAGTNYGSAVSNVLAFTISRADLSITVNITGWIVGGTPNAPTVTGNLGNGAVTYQYKVKGAADNTYTATVPTAVGNYTVKATVAQTANYNGATATADFAISTKAAQSVTADNVVVTYGDSGKKVSGTTNGNGTISYAVKSGSDVVEVNSTTGALTIKKVGTATITVTASETASHAAATKDIVVTVNPKKITAPAADTTVYTYTGSEQTYKITANDAYTVTGNKQTAANEAGYTVTVALKDKVNYQWSDNTTADKTYTFIIKKASVTAPAANNTTFTYTGKEQTYSLAANDAYTITGNKQTAANETGYTVTVALKDKVNYQWSDGSINDQTYTFIIKKASVTAPAANNTTFTYTGKEQTYSLTANDAYTITGNKQTAANETGYTVTVALKDKVNRQWSDGTTDDKTYTFIIKKATITITAKNKSAYINDEVPALSVSDYTVSGLVNNETLKTNPTIAYEVTPDMTKEGSVKILVSGAVAPDGGNYNDIVYKSGTLTITKKSSGIIFVPTYYGVTVNDAEGGSVVANKVSATVNTTITLTVSADEGYTFESVKVADESGKEIVVSESDGKFTFEMPASDVTVTATFKKIETPVNPDPVDPDPVIPSFDDVAESAYYYNAVEWAVENGITAGTSDDSFSPDMTCTRAQAVTFLWRAAGSPEPKSTEMPFEDVATEAYYYDAVLWAVENGITNGTSATTFSPDADCTRAQILTFLYRAQKSPAAAGTNPFNDVKADAYYVNAVLWAVEEKITNGTSDTTFSPDADCTRAQIVTFLYRAMGDEK